MRSSIHIFALYATAATALQLPNFQDFLPAIPISISDYLPPAAEQTHPQEPQNQSPQKTQRQQQLPHANLFHRQDSDTCPSGYNSCDNIGGPGLCCSPSARCSADAAGHVACCPRGAACTGSIGGVATAGSTDTSGGVAAATSSGSGDSGLLVTASTSAAATDNGNDDNLRTEGGFVLDGTQTVATPGAGVRGVEVPLVARAIIRMLEYVPL